MRCIGAEVWRRRLKRSSNGHAGAIARASLGRRMGERMATVGELELCYETFGSEDDPALLLVMGLGTQMIGWPTGFCEQLAARGFHVIRYDNRDIGRSTHLREVRPPSLKQLIRRDKAAAPYSLGDMAKDGIGLLDALGIERAHVAGASMGGMIAQLMAARDGARVLSLASIMSNTGNRWRGRPGLKIYPMFMRRPPHDRSGAIESTVSTMRLIGSPGFPFEEDALRALAEEGFERGYNPAGTARQLAAILTSPDRTPELRTITAPTVVIHGTRDQLVSPSGGRDTARAVPGARLVEIDGMGHDLPGGAWDRIVDAIVSNAERADASARRSAAA
jgi:pimeloyl-ACP methyl ester carboxylesterase